MRGEADFQRAVVELARLCGWKVFHARPAMSLSGRYATPTREDG